MQIPQPSSSKFQYLLRLSAFRDAKMAMGWVREWMWKCTIFQVACNNLFTARLENFHFFQLLLVIVLLNKDQSLDIEWSWKRSFWCQWFHKFLYVFRWQQLHVASSRHRVHTKVLRSICQQRKRLPLRRFLWPVYWFDNTSFFSTFSYPFGTLRYYQMRLHGKLHQVSVMESPQITWMYTDDAICCEVYGVILIFEFE